MVLTATDCPQRQ